MKKAFWYQPGRAKILLVITLILSVLFSLQSIAQTQRKPQTKPAPKPTPTPPRVIKSKPVPLSKPVKKEEKKEPAPVAAEEDAGEIIRVQSSLVAVPVSVTDAFGQPINNLAPTDFRVEEEGQAQRIEFLGEPGKTPLDLALLFDVSGSVHERFEFERMAVSSFLKSVFRPNDSATIFSVGQTPKIIVERTKDLNQVLKGALALEPTKEGTALLDTVVKATRYLRETATQGTRRVIVVISDGEDNLSEAFNLPQTLRELQQTDCMFYSINPSGKSIWLNKISLKGQSNLSDMAQITGGVAFLPDKFEDLGKAFQQIATELQAQYLIGYYPVDEKTDGKFRRIAVKVPTRPELRIRARQGYYAPKG